MFKPMEEERMVTVTDVGVLLFFVRSRDILFPKKLLKEQIKWTYFQSNICGGLRKTREL